MKIVHTNLQGILDNNEEETLEEDISLEEISKVIKILKPNKSPGEDGIISEFYQLYWQDINNEFFEVVVQIFKFEYTLSTRGSWLYYIMEGNGKIKKKKTGDHWHYWIVIIK